MRRWRLLAVLALAGLGLLVGARALVLRSAEAALAKRGLGYAGREARLLGWTWTGLHGPGVDVERVELAVGLPPRARLAGVVVDLKVASLGAGGAAGGGGSAALPVHVAVDGLRVHYDGRDLAAGLAGTLAPELALTSADGSLRREDGRLALAFQRELDLGPVAGVVDVQLHEGDAGLVQLTARSAGLVLADPRLARGALPAQPLQVTGSWTRADGALDLQGSFGAVPFQVSGVAELDGEAPQLAVALQVPDVAFADVVALFGDRVPEARRAVIGGTVAVDVDLAGPPWRVAVRPRARDLSAEGLLSDPDALRAGRITWRTRDADGNPVLRSTADRPTTTANGAPRLAAAVVAAEDGSFYAHRGYDLRAVEEALAQWSAAGPDDNEDTLRGASTLTQQLAKNLFLDGERTLARKLRELLYAVELERVLGKRGVLDLYLNIVELGPGVYGMAEGADAYFLKRPASLSWREAAYLAAILPAPRTFYAMALRGREPGQRVEQVIVRLVDAKRITADEAARARATPLRFLLPVAADGPAGGPPG